jgi:poly-gamma-glutamate system protein
MRNIPKLGSGKNQRTILILFLLSVLFFLLVRFIPSREGDTVQEEMIRASKIMSQAMDILRECRKEKGLFFDKRNDPNQTGLIGQEFSPITTSIGSLEAKRTTTNPDFAALIVLLLKEAGVKEGDTIALGASGSFPALIVSVLSAARVMDLRTLMICSLGASQWGANNPDFHWLYMQSCLFKAGIFDAQPIALSIGGEKDIGEGMASEGLFLLKKEIEDSGITFIYEPDLKRNVELKMRLYKERAGESKIKAFINIGGSWSNMGEDPDILRLKPGIAKINHIPPVEKRGIIYEMAARRIPVIHLLYMKGVAERYGLRWDPVPLPGPGESKIYQLAREREPSFILLAALYFILIIVILIFRNRLG